MDGTMTTFSKIYIVRNLSQSSKVELSCLGKGSVSYGLGADFSLASYADALWACHEFFPRGGGIRDKPKERLRRRLTFPSLTAFSRGTGIRKQLGTISSWYKRSASRNLGVNRHGTTLRQRVQRYRYWLYFFLSFWHLLCACADVSWL